MEHKQLDVVEYKQQDDEIDLFELFSSLAQQWRWLVGITVAGVLFSIAIALLIPKQYEVSTQVAVPSTADVAAVIMRGYGEQTANSLFVEYYQNLNSAEELYKIIKAGGWFEKLYPEKAKGISEAGVFSSLSDNLSITVLAPVKAKGEANSPAPSLLAITLWSKDEQVAVSFLNEYIVKINESVLEKLRLDGHLNRAFEVEKIQAEIALLRNNARKVRLLAIQKQESGNEEKIKELLQAIDLLTDKFDLDTQSELLGLKEALSLAQVMKVKMPKTIESFAKSNVTRTDINITTKSREELFLMGSDYLEGRIKIIESRQNKAPYIKEISVFKKQIDEVRNDIKLATLKSRKNDDPYITGLPALFGELDKLQALTFDFSGAKLYRLDKKASIDGKAEKPKGGLIVAVGSVLAFFIAVFVALIVGAVKRGKES